MIARSAAFLSCLTVWFGASVDVAVACSCDRPPAEVRGYAAHQAWYFARAANVASGRIISLRAGEDVVRDGRGVVLSTMRVHTVLKGDVPTGDITIVTGASSSSCGFGERLLMLAEGAGDVSLELYASGAFGFWPPANPGEFHVCYCGYIGPHPDPSVAKGADSARFKN